MERKETKPVIFSEETFQEASRREAAAEWKILSTLCDKGEQTLDQLARFEKLLRQSRIETAGQLGRLIGDLEMRFLIETNPNKEGIPAYRIAERGRELVEKIRSDG